MDINWCLACDRKLSSDNQFYCNPLCRESAERSSCATIYIKDTSFRKDRIHLWRNLVRPGSPAPPPPPSQSSPASPTFEQPSIMRFDPKSLSTPATSGQAVFSQPPSLPRSRKSLAHISTAKPHPNPPSPPFTPTDSSASSSSTSSVMAASLRYLPFPRRRASHPTPGAHPASAPQPLTTSPGSHSHSHSTRSTATPTAPVCTPGARTDIDDHPVVVPRSLEIDIPPRRRRDPFDHYQQSQADARQQSPRPDVRVFDPDVAGADLEQELALDFDWADVLVPCAQHHHYPAAPVSVHPAFLNRGRPISRTCA